MNIEDKINTMSDRLDMLEKEVEMLPSRLSVSRVALSDEIHRNEGHANSVLLIKLI